MTINNIPYFQVYAVDFLTLTQKLSEKEIFLIFSAVSEVCLYGKTNIKIESFYAKIFYEKLLKDLEKNKKKYFSSVRNGRKGGRPPDNPQVIDGLAQEEPKQNLGAKQQKQKHNKKQKQNQKLKKENTKENKFSSECIKCSDFLENIIKTKKKIKPKTTTWKSEIDKLNRIGGLTWTGAVSWERIIKALQWYQDNIGGQYVLVIESGKSLREKFIKLENAIGRGQSATPPSKAINLIEKNIESSKKDFEIAKKRGYVE